MNGWTVLCKSTDDPKLAYLEQRLTDLGIHHRRGEGFMLHGCPSMWVPDAEYERAYDLLLERVDMSGEEIADFDKAPILDDIDDDDSLFALSGAEPHDFLP